MNSTTERSAKHPLGANPQDPRAEREFRAPLRFQITKVSLVTSAATRLLFVGLLLIFSSAPLVSAPLQSPGVIFTGEFEADDWFKQWGARTPPRNVELVTADPARKFQPLTGRALRIKVNQGDHYGTSLEYRFKRQTGSEPEEIYFRYYLRLADDWNPERGGKFPGIAGTYGRAGWGGRPVNGTDGWSARGQFEGRRNGRTPIGFYAYHMDMKGKYGSQWIWERDGLGFLENNRWYCIEQQARLNTPGKADGILRGWVDGQLAFDKTDVRMRSVDALKIEMVWLNVYLGGSWTAKEDHHLYVDNVVISRQPIGPLTR